MPIEVKAGRYFAIGDKVAITTTGRTWQPLTVSRVTLHTPKRGEPFFRIRADGAGQFESVDADESHFFPAGEPII